MKSVSEYGDFHDFLMVGRFASVLMVIIKILEMAGCLANTQTRIATKAMINVIVSNLVISF